MSTQARWPVAVLGLGLVLAPSAFAQPHPPPPVTPSRSAGEEGPPDVVARYEYRARMLRVMEISDALDLTPPQAMQVSDTVARFDERRIPLQRELQQQAQVLRRAARGNAAYFDKVEHALARVQELRQELRRVDQELFTALSKGLPPQQKARLALTLAHLPAEMRDVLRDSREEQKEERGLHREKRRDFDERRREEPRDGE